MPYVHPLLSSYLAIPDNTKVWITVEGKQTSDQVQFLVQTPHVDVVKTSTGTVGKNRHHLAIIPRSSVASGSPCSSYSLNVPVIL